MCVSGFSCSTNLCLARFHQVYMAIVIRRFDYIIYIQNVVCIYSKNPCLLRNHILPNEATNGVEEPEGSNPSGFWDPNVSRVVIYVISQLICIP